MLWNANEEEMEPRMHVGSQRQGIMIHVEAAVSPAIDPENRSLAGEGAKGISLPTRAKAQPVPEELRLLVFLSLVQAACLPIHRWAFTRQPQLLRVGHRVRDLDQQVRTALHRLHLHCLVHINSVTRQAQIQLSPCQLPSHHRRRDDVSRMTRIGYPGLAHRLPYLLNTIRQTSTNLTRPLFHKYRINSAKADEQCRVRSPMCNPLRCGLPGLLLYAENTLAGPLLGEVKARKAAQVTMMKVKAFKWTLYLTVKAMGSVCALKVPKRGKGEASDKGVQSLGVLGYKRTAFHRRRFSHSIFPSAI